MDKECSVAEAGGWVENRWVWGIRWRRELREWELSDLNSIVDLLVCRSSGSTNQDTWVWKPGNEGVYSVRSSYDCLLKRKLPPSDGATRCCSFIWKNFAVPKAQATAWRVLLRKIATRKELKRRGVPLSAADARCALCGDVEETVSHLFFQCNYAWDLWSSCLDWIGVVAPLSVRAADNFYQFCNLGKGKEIRSFLASLWVCVVWLIWKKRNEVVFQEGEWSKDKILSEVKSYLWCWEKGKSPHLHLNLNFRSWSVNPKLLG